MTDTRTTPLIRIQTASGWPSTDEGWTTQRQLRWGGGSEGAGQVVGDARLVQIYGSQIDDGASRIQTRTRLQGLVGRYVRVLAEDDSGSITLEGITWSAFWHGQVVGTSIAPDNAPANAGGTFELACTGLASVLDQVTIYRGYETSAGTSEAVDPGFCPPFNNLPGGDRSLSTRNVGGTSVYVHDRSDDNKWTAAQILDLLLAGHVDPPLPPDFTGRSNLTWTVGGLIAALDYQPDRLDLHGMTVLEAVNTLINPRRGLTWRLSISGATATIVVESTSAAGITVGSFGLPAATSTATLSYQGTSVWVDDLQLVPDHSSVYDAIFVVGAHPRAAISLEWPGDFVDGWSSSAELAYDPDDDHNANAANNLAWQRFEINSSYNGNQMDSASVGLRNVLAYTTTDDPAYGLGGYTGERSYTSDGSPTPAPEAHGLHADRTLPMGVRAITRLRDQERPPGVFRQDGDGSWTDLSAELAVRIDEDPLTVWLGSGPKDVAFPIRDYFEGSVSDPAQRLVFTLSIREPKPLQVSWIRPRQDWPRDLPRIRTIHLPDAEQWVVLEGTVVGVGSGGFVSKTGSTQTVRDDLPTLRAVLALVRPWYSDPSYRVSWRDRGTLDYGSTYRPGTLLTSVTTADGTTTTDALIVRRRWIETPYGYDTVYEAERITPSIEAVL